MASTSEKSFQESTRRNLDTYNTTISSAILTSMPSTSLYTPFPIGGTKGEIIAEPLARLAMPKHSLIGID